MATRLGLHISSGNRTGWVASYLAPCAQAGAPIPVIFALDQNVWNDVAANSPQTRVIFRTQKDIHGNDIGDDPGNLYIGDPVASAHGWIALVMPMWKLNQAHYYAPINEPTPPDLISYAWLDIFMQTCMQDGDANGFKLANYAFSVGNPSDADTTVEQKLMSLVPSLQYAKAHGHILLLHEYGLDSPAVGNAPAGTLQASAPSLALRYRRVLAYLEQHNADCPIVISEASAGTGYLPARGSLSLNQYLTDLEWYDANLRAEPRVIGCCVYQLGGAENCLALLPPLAAYIQSTPPITLPPPPDPCADVIQRYEEIVAYQAAQIKQRDTTIAKQAAVISSLLSDISNLKMGVRTQAKQAMDHLQKIISDTATEDI